ncbi:MAG: META domain-containing protein, partial [Acidobacteria bacterium]|nr:META domain-containing protein [Acidobacteriota bacterium]
MSTKILFAFLFLFGLSEGVSAQGRDITSTKWDLTHLNGRIVRNSRAFFEIDAAGRRYTGNAGCNQMSGNVTITRSQIDFGAAGT